MVSAFGPLSTLLLIFAERLKDHNRESIQRMKMIASSNNNNDNPNTVDSTDDTCTQSDELSSSMHFSLWLIPPKDIVGTIQKQIDKFSENNSRGPSFYPHITIIGNVPCRSEQHAKEITDSLREGLHRFGKTPCTFDSDPYLYENKWNQALVLSMNKDPRFLDLCKKCRRILGMETENWDFPPPGKILIVLPVDLICFVSIVSHIIEKEGRKLTRCFPVRMPHLSLFYGVSNIPDRSEVEPLPPFDTYTIALWKTEPATLDGVPNWTKIADIDLQ